MDKLCRDYWHPIHAQFVIRGVDVETAKDLTQSFLSQIVTDGFLHRADPTRGRFRTFLLGALNHFITSHWRVVYTEKRGGKEVHISTSDLEEEIPEPVREGEFDREWAYTVLRQALDRTRTETGEDSFATLKHFLPGGGAPPMAYETAAVILGWPLGTVKSEVHRLRERLRDYIRQEVVRTVGSPAEIDEEMAYLHRILRATG